MIDFSKFNKKSLLARNEELKKNKEFDLTHAIRRADKEYNAFMDALKKAKERYLDACTANIDVYSLQEEYAAEVDYNNLIRDGKDLYGPKLDCKGGKYKLVFDGYTPEQHQLIV